VFGIGPSHWKYTFGAINLQSNSAFVKDPQPVQCASALLGVSVDEMGEALVTGTAFQKGVKLVC